MMMMMMTYTVGIYMHIQEVIHTLRYRHYQKRKVINVEKVSASTDCELDPKQRSLITSQIYDPILLNIGIKAFKVLQPQ